MKTILNENTWLSREGRFAMKYGWGNGYVLIPRDHCLWGVDYDDISVNVHGGLTFSKLITLSTFDIDPMTGEPFWPGLAAEDLDCWMVGFDTCHSGDTLERWSKEAVQAEADRLAEQLDAITSFAPVSFEAEDEDAEREGDQ